MMYLAIDPGKKGAFAAIGIQSWDVEGIAAIECQVVHEESGLLIKDMPTYEEANASGEQKRQYDCGEIYAALVAIKQLASINGGMEVVIEEMRQSPKGGQGDGFKRGGFGDFSTGEFRGIIRMGMAVAEIRYDWLNPLKWKRHYKLRGGHEHKADSIPVAKRLFPEVANAFKRVSIDHNRADAVLMANYAKQVMAWDRMGAFR